jgi:hypothetical protein
VVPAALSYAMDARSQWPTLVPSQTRQSAGRKVTGLFRHDQVHIVIEGVDRLRWSGPEAHWRLSGLWPFPDDRALLDRVLEQEEPLLVVIPQAEPTIMFLSEQLEASGPLWNVLGCTDIDGVVEARVPLCDWAPIPIRRRAVAFSRAACLTAARMHPCDLPPMLFESPPPGGTQVRFARCTPACQYLSEALLRSAASRAFSSERVSHPSLPLVESLSA